MSSAIKILPHYTYDDYVHWDGNWELIEGIPYAMSPQPLPKHQQISASISSSFFVALRNCKKCTVYQPIDYKIAEDTILQPDMLVVCRPITKKFLDFAPALVLEIISPSSALKDRHTKFEIYQTEAVPFFVIISPDEEEAEIYELINNSYTLTQRGRSFLYTFSLHDCKAEINFAEIWQ